MKQIDYDIVKQNLLGNERWSKVPDVLLYNILQCQAIKTEPFSEEMAVMDMLYWVGQCKLYSKGYYVKRWKWTPGKVRSLFIRYGVEDKPPSWGKQKTNFNVNSTNKQPEISRSANKNEDSTTCEQPLYNLFQQHINRNSFKEKDKTIFHIPTIEEVQTYCELKRYPPLKGVEFFTYYSKRNWKTKTDSKPIQNWTLSLDNWVRRKKPILSDDINILDKTINSIGEINEDFRKRLEQFGTKNLD